MAENKPAETKEDWMKVLEAKEAKAAKVMAKIDQLGGWDAKIEDLKLANKRMDLRKQHSWLMINISQIKEIINEF
jgi:hypothetical protein